MFCVVFWFVASLACAGELPETDDESELVGVGDVISMDRCLAWEEKDRVYSNTTNKTAWKLTPQFMAKVASIVQHKQQQCHCTRDHLQSSTHHNGALVVVPTAQAAESSSDQPSLMDTS